MSWLRTTLLLALLVLTSGFVDAQSEKDLGRFRERLRASHAKFDDVFVRALRAENPDLDEALEFLEHDAFALRARAVELLDVIDREREHNLFAGQLDALIAEEARLESLEPEINALLLEDPAQAITAAELHQLHREGSQQLRRELAKLGWRHGDRASRAALRILLQAQPSDTFSARALADIGGASGMEAIVAILEQSIVNRRDRAKALIKAEKTIAALRKQAALERKKREKEEAAAKKRGEHSPQGRPPIWPPGTGPTGPPSRGPRPAPIRSGPSKVWLLKYNWSRYFERLAATRVDEQATLTAVMQDVTATFKSPRVPKPTAARGAWPRWWKKTQKSWPTERTPGPVVFRSKDAFDTKLAAINERHREATEIDAYLAAIDELDASLGTRRGSANVALILFNRLKVERFGSRTRKQRSAEVPLAAWVHIVRLLTLRPNTEALGELLPEWLGRTAFTETPAEPYSPSLARYKETYSAFVLAQPQEQRHRTFRALSKRGSVPNHKLTTWMLDELLSESSNARDWHLAVEFTRLYEDALTEERAEDPVLRVVLESIQAKLVKRLYSWAEGKQLADPPVREVSADIWKEWIERVAPLDAR